MATVVCSALLLNSFSLIGQCNPSNLFFNPEFDLGINGFYTDYATPAAPCPSSDCLRGGYMVCTKEVSDYHSILYGSAPDGGNFLAVNGSSIYKDNHPFIVFAQVVSVKQHRFYYLEGMVMSLYPVNPAQLQIQINNAPIYTFEAPSESHAWVPFGTFWYSGNESYILISVYDLNLAGFGNDFALDKISFSELCPLSLGSTPGVAVASTETISIAQLLFGNEELAETEITVMDVQGKIVSALSGGSAALPHGLAPGMYVAQGRNREAWKQVKIIVY
jgi:hypothetical protein